MVLCGSKKCCIKYDSHSTNWYRWEFRWFPLDDAGGKPRNVSPKLTRSNLACGSCWTIKHEMRNSLNKRFSFLTWSSSNLMSRFLKWWNSQCPGSSIWTRPHPFWRPSTIRPITSWSCSLPTTANGTIFYRLNNAIVIENKEEEEEKFN